MMREPEDLLRTIPPESPPPEVVMAAIRVFRYRAIAAIGLACALVLSAFVVKSALERDGRLQEQIGAIRYTTGSTMNIADLHQVNGVKVMLWEIVVDEADTAYVHVFAWDPRGRDFSLAISDPQADGRTVTLGSLEGYGGGATMTHSDLWQEIRVPSSAEELSFTVDVRAEKPGVSGSIPFNVNV